MSRASSVLSTLRRARAAAAEVAMVAALLLVLAACTDGLTPPAPVASVTVSPDTATVLVAETQQLSATLRSARGTVLTGRRIDWSSSDTAVAKVTATGLVTGSAVGLATITATSEGRSDSARIAVLPPNPVPTLTSLTPDAVAAGRRAFTLVVRGSGFLEGSVVRWNGAVRAASFVSATELQVPIGESDVAQAGTVEVSVHNPAPGGGTASRSLRVAAGPSLRIPADSLLLSVGDTAWLQASVVDASGQPVPNPQITWERVAGEDIGFGLSAAGVSARVRGQGLGRFRLVARSDAGLADTLLIRVRSIQQHLVSVTAGNSTSCGLDAQGRGNCWGYAYHDGDRLGMTFAPAPLGGSVRFQQLSVGHQHACGLALDGRAYCWGINNYGELGTGGPFAGTGWMPVPVASNRTYASLSTHGWHTCALTSPGELDCWGANDYGQIGDGTQQDRFTPIAVGGTLRFASVSVGGYHSCALDATGRAYCWGANNYGQLGRGSATSHEALPAPIASDLRFTRIAVGGAHSCGLTSNGTAYCWGGNYYGQLGNGSTDPFSLVPVAVAGGRSFAALEATWHTCGRTAAGEVYCWGQNDSGENGIAPELSESCIWHNTHYACNRTPVRLGGALAFSALSVGAWHTCGMSADGRPFCWGENYVAQLGVGLIGGYSSQPLQVRDGRLSNAAALASSAMARVSASQDMKRRRDSTGRPELP